MPSEFAFSERELNLLRRSMDWVIPPDSSPGAGSELCVARLLDLLERLGDEAHYRYRRSLPQMVESDFEDTSNEFAQEFIDHVRDVYYGSPDTGAWEDIGFKRSSDRG
jgi:hypothetical protein